MENKKQTAINWLINQIKDQHNQKEFTSKQWLEVIEQAKAMEKEYITEFADEYADAVMGGCIKRAEQYYNETYEK